MTEKDFIRVDEWKPKKEDFIIQKDGKLIFIPFDKIFDRPSLEILNNFLISKDSYVNGLDDIIRYLNYFIKFYDKDNELILSYLRIRFLLSEPKNSFSIKSFNKLIEETLLTESIRNKIKQMVEDNYYIDLSSKKKNVKYSESLEFTNEHAKTLHEISTAMKIIIPVVFHFLNLKGIDKKNLYKIYYINLTIFFQVYSALFLSQLQISSKVIPTSSVSICLFLAKSPNVRIPTILLFSMTGILLI